MSTTRAIAGGHGRYATTARLRAHWAVISATAFAVAMTACDRAPSSENVATPKTPAAGEAHLTVDGTLLVLGELACHTTRAPDGSVVGWIAQFSRPAAKADDTTATDRDETTVKPSGSLWVYVTGYRGDGTYTREVGLRAGLRYRTESGETSTEKARALVLSNGGKSAELLVGDRSVVMTCDARQDTAATAVTDELLGTPEPGTAYVVDPHGSVLHFSSVRCGQSGDTLHVVSGDPAAEPGQRSLEIWLARGWRGAGDYQPQELSYRYHFLQEQHDDLEPPVTSPWGSLDLAVSEVASGKKQGEKKAEKPPMTLRIISERPLSGEFARNRDRDGFRGAFNCAQQ